jgi:site-specific recombinase XerD
MAEKSDATRRAYRSDFDIFVTWCSARGVVSLPATPETVRVFLASQAIGSVKASTLGRRVAAIRYAHKLAGFEPPTNSELVKAELRGIRRTIGAAPEQKDPATADRVVSMVAMIPDTLAGLRDRALLLLGFAGAFRRSELVALTVADLTAAPGGMRVMIRRSKTDQEGRGKRSRSRPGVSFVPWKRSRRGSPLQASPKGQCSAPSTAAAGCCPML